jgi:nitrogen fixation protein FixH
VKRPKLWPGMVFGLLSINVTVVGITVYLANADRSFAVEPDYYQKALRWDATAREHAASKELGWRIEVDPGAVGAAGRHVRITIRDRDGKPVDGARVRVTAFSALRAVDRHRADLEPLEPGVYGADMGIVLGGRWEFEVRATRGTDVFVERAMVTVPGQTP